MKILKLKFKNINSLKDDQEIDFQRQDLINTGIILICGPTGSGKSTILDVITLALYNKIPRFSEAISKGSMTTNGAIITHHTRNALAEVYYTVGNKNYVSRWTISYNRNNNLKDYDMELWDLTNDKKLDLKRSEVPDENTRIIGLTYDQFVRSILLSQGEFSKFLKSTPDEKADLLEKLTGVEIYRKIGTAVFQKNNAIKAQIEAVKLQLSSLEILSPQQLEELDLEIQNLNLSKKRNEEVFSQLNTQKVKKEAFDKYIFEKNRLQILISNLKSEYEQFGPSKIKIDDHEKLQIVADHVAQYNLLIKSSGENKNELSFCKSEQLNYQQRLDDIFTAFKKIYKDEVTMINLYKTMEAAILLYSNKSNELQKITENGKTIRATLHRFESHAIYIDKENIQNLADDAHKIAWIQAQVGSNNALIKNMNLNTDDVLQLQNKTVALQYEIERINGVSTQIKEIEKNKILQSENQKLLHDYTLEKSTIDGKIKIEDALLSKLDETIASHLLVKEEKIRTASFDEHRKSLMPGMPCPLCGSTTHLMQHSHDAGDIANLEVEIKNLQVKFQIDSKALNDLRAEYFLKNQKIIDVERNQLKLTAAIAEIESVLGGESENDLQKIDAELVLLRSTVKSLQTGINLIHQNNEYLQLLYHYNQLTLEVKEFKRVGDELSSKFSKKNCEDELRQLKHDFEASNEKLKRQSTKMEELIKSSAKLNDDISNLETLILSKVKSENFYTITEVQNALLDVVTFNALWNQWDSIMKRGNVAKSELLKTEQLIDDLKNENIDKLNIEDLIHELKSLRATISTIDQNLGGLKERQFNAKTSQEKSSKLLEELNSVSSNQELYALLSKLIGDAQGKIFTRFAQDLTLSQILILANRHLQSFTDRYILIKKEDESFKSDIFIVDKYMGDVERSVKTLSGGENFIVSLSLALSLSDLASHNIRLESLFIDEGFGTLDEETLNTVIDTLEKLQQKSEKTIVIITHVEQLKERIHSKIQLIKNNQGYSVIV